MIERASPTQQRAALETANMFVKAGIGFVPVPVANAAEFAKLVNESMARLDELEKAADEPVGAKEKE
jgi:hypothetical protein